MPASTSLTCSLGRTMTEAETAVEAQLVLVILPVLEMGLLVLHPHLLLLTLHKNPKSNPASTTNNAITIDADLSSSNLSPCQLQPQPRILVLKPMCLLQPIIIERPRSLLNQIPSLREEQQQQYRIPDWCGGMLRKLGSADGALGVPCGMTLMEPTAYCSSPGSQQQQQQQQWRMHRHHQHHHKKTVRI